MPENSAIVAPKETSQVETTAYDFFSLKYENSPAYIGANLKMAHQYNALSFDSLAYPHYLQI